MPGFVVFYRLPLAHHLRSSCASKTAAFPLGIKLSKEQWDSTTNLIVDHPEGKFWNNIIAKRKIEIDTLILKLEDADVQKLNSMSALEIRDYVLKILSPDTALTKTAKKPKEDPNTFLKWFDRFMNRKQGRTRSIYEATRRRLAAWLESEEELAKVKFEDIMVAWLAEFENFLCLTAAPNSNAIHFRNIRTVVNYDKRLSYNKFNICCISLQSWIWRIVESL